MRLVIQRVTQASVTVDGELTGSIERGLLVLCGIHETDDDAAAEWAARKLLNVRLWDDGGKAWARSALQNEYGVLLVSQFTLFATLKGNKPDFHRAMGPQQSRPFWDKFVKRVEGMHKGPVQQGRFGAKMDVQLNNDGPVTIVLDSPEPTAAPVAAPAAPATSAVTLKSGAASLGSATASSSSSSSSFSAASSKAAVQTSSPARIVLLLKAAGASTPLRDLQERGLQLCGLKTIRAGAEIRLAAVMRVPPHASSGAVAALAARLCEAGAARLDAEVSERWQEHFTDAELC